MRFRMFETSVTVSFLFLATICLLLLTDRTGLILPMILAAVLHETGHLLCMRLLDCAPSEIRLILGGVSVTSGSLIDERDQLWISLSGPLVNLLLFLVLFINCKVFGEDTYMTFAAINLLFGVYNLLPFNGLDGGTVLDVLFTRRYGANRAAVFLNFISFLAAIAVLCLAVTGSLKGHTEYTVYIVAVYLILSVLLKL